MTLAWILFNLFVLAFLALDLRVFHKEDKIQGFKDALFWSLLWISLSFIFAGGVYLWQGKAQAVDYVTAYIIEKSLSMDNLFVFLMIFKSFNIPQKYQHRVLFWGIIGALILRAIMIIVGAHLINTFHFTIYIFGSFLIFTGVKILFQGERNFEFRKRPLFKMIQYLIPLTHKFKGHHFFIKEKRKWRATPLFLALIMVEFSDVIFAVDSIPAVLAVSTDTFIVYTSNIFAILGLRSLYFLLASLVHNMRFLDTGLSYILIFVGIKMILSPYYKVPTHWSLLVICSILGASILASLLWPAPKQIGK